MQFIDSLKFIIRFEVKDIILISYYHIKQTINSIGTLQLL